ncbi:MAG TPA: hypothetical protein VK059_02235, partial [Nocardioidaceae bacterium]|nr:hypothetical protein [Nocardioidaceae bacterium]
MKKNTALAATLLAGGMALGVGSAGSASAAAMPGGNANAASTPTTSAIASAQDVGPAASCNGPSEGSALIPDGEGSHAGVVYWHDYNNHTGSDQDNFLITDRKLDG